MDNRPIGVFDSGLGGVSVLYELKKQLPNETFIYYGDTLHAPYGDQPPEKIKKYTRDAVDFLLEKQCKAIVIACNTATAVAVKELRSIFSFPIIGMEPALKPASLLQGEGKILVMATSLTLSQDKFLQLMLQYGKDALPLPCPGLVECIEKENWEIDEINNKLINLLQPYIKQKLKAVVLGCTHYIFIKKMIKVILGEETILIDGNNGTANELHRRLKISGLETSSQEKGTIHFYSSKTGKKCTDIMKKMLAFLEESKQLETGKIN